MLDITLNLVVGILLLYLAKGNEALKKIKIFDKGELTIVISEIKEGTNLFGFLTESDKKIIKNMLKNKSIKDIIKKFSNKKIPKKTIYDFCLKLKNED